MHEIGLIQTALEIATSCAAQQGAQRIHTLTLRVGALSGTTPESLAFAFGVLRQGTLAEDADLRVEWIPVVCYCADCKAEFEPDGLFYACPQCNRLSAEVRRGRELEVTSVEVS